MFGIDLSSYQDTLNVGEIVGIDFVICKATGGTRYINPSCDKHMQQAIKRGLMRGVYHFAGDGFADQGAEVEAKFFVDNIRGYLDGETLLVLDWESVKSENIPVTRGVGWALTWLRAVEALTGVKPLIYMNSATLHAHNWASVVAEDYGLWLANFDGSRLLIAPGDISSGAWPFYAIRQYSEHGQLQGYQGNLDLNHTTMSRDGWRAYGGGNSVAGNGKTVDELAREVLDNKWGTGQDRINRLTAAGHSAGIVQARVNQIMADEGVKVHIVKRGENLSTIAEIYGTTWQRIYDDNRQAIGNSPNIVMAGTRLVIR